MVHQNDDRDDDSEDEEDHAKSAFTTDMLDHLEATGEHMVDVSPLLERGIKVKHGLDDFLLPY